ncbi:thioredoxin family protein [Rhodococcus sp. NPDC058532]|uniref:thioredoxin family protein n=1 Tax=Rhodococcus sp. NPDC058532 TaxID=3346540 RepID=UPI00365630AD
MTGIVVLAVVLVAALVVALILRSRSGTVRATTPAVDPTDTRAALLAAVGVPDAGPTVLHFSADWCGPCAAVRRVVAQTLSALDGRLAPDVPRPVDLELDIDEHPALARELGVLSLPTTFILDGSGEQRFRVSGVPTAADLEAALVPLCEPKGSDSSENR